MTHGKSFRTEKARKELINLTRKKINQLLNYSTLKEFTDELYKLAWEGKN
jgi:hypothetical protein